MPVGKIWKNQFKYGYSTLELYKLHIFTKVRKCDSNLRWSIHEDVSLNECLLPVQRKPMLAQSDSLHSGNSETTGTKHRE